jgi:REP element-mobilizing transposase RayT
MQPTPIYQPANLNPAYQLRFSWTGFPARGTRFPANVSLDEMDELTAAWESEGIRVLEHRWTAEQIQATLSVVPQVSPIFLAARVKGRLQHAMRKRGQPVAFARNFSVRSLGDATREAVENYVRRQVERADLVDPAYREQLRRCMWHDRAVDLSKPSNSSSALYWYNLHVVLISCERYRMGAKETAQTVRDTCRAVAAKHEYGISTLSVMPDHLHIAMRGNLAHSPEQIALRLQNNTAWKLGQVKFWEHNYYAGTFGEYTMHAVRS